MKSKLPVLTAVVMMALGGYAGYRSQRARPLPSGESPAMPGAASTAPSSAPAKSTAGDQLVTQARTQLERRASVAARLRHQVLLDGRQLRGVGSYWQQGQGDELRVRLELQTVGEESSLLQVSNGPFLWTDRRLAIGRTITRLDLRKLRNEVARASDEFGDVAPGQASWFPSQPELSLYCGGLPTLLTALSQNFNFLPPQSMRWTPDPPLAGLPETLPVFAVVGHWRSESLAAIAPAAKDHHAIPQRLPQEVLVLFGQSDLFPYRIEFRQLLNPPPNAAAKPITPFQLSGEPLVMMEAENVAFDAPIAPGQFDYLPGDAEWDDHTAEYLDKIRRERQAQLAARQREQR